MFCIACGAKLDKGDMFCTECGARIVSRTDKSATNLESKIWYRALKVIYVLLYTIVIMVVIGVGYSEFPQPQISNERSSIECANGRTFTLKQADIYLYGTAMGLSMYDDETARKRCYTPPKKESYTLNELKFVPTEKNYTLKLVHDSPDYIQWILWVILIPFLGCLLFLKLLRIISLYILKGRSNWQQEMFGKIY